MFTYAHKQSQTRNPSPSLPPSLSQTADPDFVAAVEEGTKAGCVFYSKANNVSQVCLCERVWQRSMCPSFAESDTAIHCTCVGLSGGLLC